MKGLAGSSLDDWYLKESKGKIFYEYGTDDNIADIKNLTVEIIDKEKRNEML